MGFFSDTASKLKKKFGGNTLVDSAIDGNMSVLTGGISDLEKGKMPFEESIKHPLDILSDPDTQKSKMRQTGFSRVDLAPETKLGLRAYKKTFGETARLQELVNRGLSEADLNQSLEAQARFASGLKRASGVAGQDVLPSQADIQATSGIAQNLFAPERQALQQSFMGQTMAARSEAARLGRSTTDPILQARLRQGFMQQEGALASRQQQAAQQLALQLPEQRLQRSLLQADLAGKEREGIFGIQQFQSQLGMQREQANIQNKAGLVAALSQVLNNERQFRIQSGTTRTGGTQTGMQANRQGALGQLGGVAGIVGSIFGMGGLSGFGGGGGGAPVANIMPTPTSNYSTPNTTFASGRNPYQPHYGI
jgi:hypothetical protein